MKQRTFPPGWDEDRVKRVLAHYASQSEEEAIAEDETADPILGLGERPIACGVPDASEHLDRYLYKSDEQS